MKRLLTILLALAGALAPGRAATVNTDIQGGNLLLGFTVPNGLTEAVASGGTLSLSPGGMLTGTGTINATGMTLIGFPGGSTNSFAAILVNGPMTGTGSISLAGTASFGGLVSLGAGLTTNTISLTGLGSFGSLSVASNSTPLGNLVTAYNVRAYGAKGNGAVLSFSAMTANSTSFSSASGSFVSGDVGKLILVPGAGPGGYGLQTTIASVSTSTLVHLTASASTTITSTSESAAIVGTNDTAALQALFAALPASGSPQVYFPAGYYLKTDTLTISVPVRIIGDGSGFMNNQPGSSAYGPVQGASAIVDTSSTSTGFYVNTPGAGFAHLFVDNETGDTPISGAGINFVNGQYAYIEDITIDNYYNNAPFTQDAFVHMSNSYLLDSVSTSITMANTANADDGDNRWQGNTLAAWRYPNRATWAPVLWLSGGGTYFIGNKINANATIDFLVAPAAGINTQQLYIEGNSLEGQDQYGIIIQLDLAGVNSGVMQKFNISGNEIFSTVAGFAMNPAVSGQLSDVQIYGNSIWAPTAIILKNTSTVSIGINTGSSSTALNLETGNTNVWVQPQLTNNSPAVTTGIMVAAAGVESVTTSIGVASVSGAMPTTGTTALSTSNTITTASLAATTATIGTAGTKLTDLIMFTATPSSGLMTVTNSAITTTSAPMGWGIMGGSVTISASPVFTFYTGSFTATVTTADTRSYSLTIGVK